VTARTRREYLLAVLSVGVGAAVIWWAASWDWIVVRESLLPGSLVTDATTSGGIAGSQVVPGIAGMAILGLAGVAGIVGSRGWIRRIIGGLVVGAGLVVVIVLAPLLTTSGLVARAPEGAEAVDALLRGPWVALVGGALMSLGGVLAVLRGHSWRSLGRAYELPSGGAPKDAWDALDRGIDPTVDDGDESR
jgi:uncharacterized membrane protein (TIGR02234 family)